MVYKIGGSTPATVKIGGSTGIKTTTPVSYSAPKASTPVSYSNPVKSTPVVSTPKVTSSVLSPTIKAAVAASSSNVSVVPKSIQVATTPILSQSVNKAVSNIINVSNQNATIVPKSITVATAPVLSPSLNKTVVENVAIVKQANTVSIPNVTVATTPILSSSIKTEVSNIVNNVSNIAASIPKPEEKLVIQSITPKATFDSSVPLLGGSIKSTADVAKYSERKDTDKITFSDKDISDFNKYTSQANLKSIPVKSSISKITSPTATQQNTGVAEHPASQAYPLYDNSVIGGEELVGPQPTSFEWTMPAGKIGSNYVDAQGNIMSKDAYVTKYNVDPDYALWYMRTGQAAKELATTGQKSAQLSTIVTPTQYSVQNPITIEYQTMEHPASQAYPLVDNSVVGGEELVGPQPTSFEWTMPSGKIGPNYVDAKGDIMSKDAYIQKYNVDPEYALQYMRSNQAGKELDNTISGRSYQDLSTIG